MCAALTQAADFRRYISAAVPPHNLRQVFHNLAEDLTEDQDWAALLKLRISLAITQMIIRDLQPVSLALEKQGFRDLLQLPEPCYCPESPQLIQT